MPLTPLASKSANVFLAAASSFSFLMRCTSDNGLVVTVGTWTTGSVGVIVVSGMAVSVTAAGSVTGVVGARPNSFSSCSVSALTAAA